MQIDQCVTILDDFRVYGIRNDAGDAATGTARKRPVQVAPVRQLAIAGAYTFMEDRKFYRVVALRRRRNGR
jgi:hypothetical protein